jgi:hypothetical protein
VRGHDHHTLDPLGHVLSSFGVESFGHFTPICYDAAVVRTALPAVFLLLLLAAYPLIGALPSEAGSIRVAGLSVLWWYGAVVAPALAWLTAVVLHR